MLVLWDKFVELLEAKEEEKLIEMERNNSNRVYKDCSGKWQCPPAEEYCKRLGIRFRIVSSNEINYTLYNNMEFLRDYIRYSTKDVDIYAKEIREFVIGNQGITLKALISEYPSDHVYATIAKNYIFVDLYDQKLSRPETVWVYSNKQTYEAYKICRESEKIKLPVTLDMSPGAVFNWDGIPHKIINVGKTMIFVQKVNTAELLEISNNQFYALFSQGRLSGLSQSISQNYMISSVLRKANDNSFQEALQRYHIIRPFVEGAEKDRKKAKVPVRTLERWLSAKKAYGKGFLGLIPRLYDRGNRGPKRIGEAIDWMKELIQDNKIGANINLIYGSYLNRCEKHTIQPVSLKTFYTYDNAQDKYEKTLKQHGQKAAYKHEPVYWQIDEKTPPHGDRPFQGDTSSGLSI